MEKITQKLSDLELQGKVEEIRRKVLDFHRLTGRSHVGSSLSCVDILSTLFYGIKRPEDVVLLSKGHGSSALYVILNDLGIIPDNEMNNLAAHPDFNPKHQIWATTGSLGHGLSVGAGIAYAESQKKVYVVLGDGECDEGQIWEAARLSSELDLRNLTAIVDCNGLQGFKKNDYTQLESRFNAFGWSSGSCDGHDSIKLREEIAMQASNPRVILAKTIKAKGIPEVEGTLRSHYYSIPKSV